MQDKQIKGLVVFDCDSTLSQIEGVDELAGLKGPAVKQAVEKQTNAAMAGEIAIKDVFKARMDVIRPSLADCQNIGKLYIKHIEPTAKETIEELQRMGFTVAILSGGFYPVIQPLADFLKISIIEAVPLFFNKDGSYSGFDEEYPTTRNGGKTEIIEALKNSLNPPKTIMVGDGISDLETKDAVNLFVGFGKFAERSTVKQKADEYIYSLAEIIPLLKKMA